jgi:hypothetical protein
MGTVAPRKKEWVISDKHTEKFANRHLIVSSAKLIGLFGWTFGSYCGNKKTRPQFCGRKFLQKQFPNYF